MKRSICVLTLALTVGARADTPAQWVERLFANPPAYVAAQQVKVYLSESPSTSSVVVISDGQGGVHRKAGVIEWLTFGGKSWTKMGGTWTTAMDANFAPKNRAELVISNYMAKVEQAGSIAGRPTVKLVLTPKRPFDPSRTIWFDRDRKVVLGDRSDAPDGKVRSLTWTLSVTYGVQRVSKPSKIADSPPGYGPSSFEPLANSAEVVERTGLNPPKPSHVPIGYRLATLGAMQTGSGRWMPAARWTNGIAAFTVFERGVGRGRGWQWGRRGGRSREPVTDRQQAVVAHDRGGRSYLLIGDLAESELKRVAFSL